MMESQKVIIRMIKWDGHVAACMRESGERGGKPKNRETGLKTCAKRTGALFYVTTRIHSSRLMAGSTPLATILICSELGSTRCR
jgi:hypothetical protein